MKNRVNKQTRKENKIKKSKSSDEQPCHRHLGAVVGV